MVYVNILNSVYIINNVFLAKPQQDNFPLTLREVRQWHGILSVHTKCGGNRWTKGDENRSVFCND